MREGKKQTASLRRLRQETNAIFLLIRCVSECGSGDEEEELLETVFDVKCLVERVNG